MVGATSSEGFLIGLCPVIGGRDVRKFDQTSALVDDCYAYSSSRNRRKAYMHQSGVRLSVCLSVCLSRLPHRRKAVVARPIRILTAQTDSGEVAPTRPAYTFWPEVRGPTQTRYFYPRFMLASACVSMCVCHTPVLYRTACPFRVDFWHMGSLDLS